MKKQLIRISPHQSSKVMAALYVLLTIPLFVIGLVSLLFADNSEGSFMSIFFIIAPLVYGVLGYLGFAFFCWLYNLVAKRIGGIEFSVVENPDA